MDLLMLVQVIVPVSLFYEATRIIKRFMDSDHIIFPMRSGILS